jgi:hypothetical protein
MYPAQDMTPKDKVVKPMMEASDLNEENLKQNIQTRPSIMWICDDFSYHSGYRKIVN